MLRINLSSMQEESLLKLDMYVGLHLKCLMAISWLILNQSINPLSHFIHASVQADNYYIPLDLLFLSHLAIAQNLLLLLNWPPRCKGHALAGVDLLQCKIVTLNNSFVVNKVWQLGFGSWVQIVTQHTKEAPQETQHAPSKPLELHPQVVCHFIVLNDMQHSSHLARLQRNGSCGRTI